MIFYRILELGTENFNLTVLWIAMNFCIYKFEKFILINKTHLLDSLILENLWNISSIDSL